MEKPRDICQEYGISVEHELDSLRESLMSVVGLSELFKVLADETRTQILHLLSARELCVCDLSLILQMTPPAVSHHLRLLKMMNLVRYRRAGKMVYYSLDDNHVLELISVASDHYREIGERKQT